MLNRRYLLNMSLFFTLFLIIAGCGGGSSSSGGAGDAIITDNTTISTGSVTLSWNAPLTNADGSPLTDLSGYKVYYGPRSGYYTESLALGDYTGASISNLSSGTWCFAVKAYDTSGNESDYSNEECTTIAL